MSDRSKPTRVLCVDDSAVVRARVEEYLESSDDPKFTRVVACNCEEAIDRLKRSQVDVVLLDLGLPDSQGLETLTRVHQASGTTPIVVLTGSEAESLGKHAIKKGAQDYLLKQTLEPDALIRSIQYAIERHRLQERLHQLRKMEAITQLAGGVAHEYNNLLTIIHGYAELLRDRVPDDPILRRGVEKIREATVRATNLTRQLVSYSAHQKPVAPHNVDINRVVVQAARFLRPLVGERIQLSTEVEEGIGGVMIDPGRLQEAILTLAANARDAMPEGGTLTLGTSTVEIGEEGSPGVEGLPPGPYCALSVVDTGAGMDEETRLRAFEPFFSTKEVGHGTGLGLAVVQGTVRQAGGLATIESVPDSGSTVRLLLPKVDLPKKQSVPAAVDTDDLRGDGKTVLVVEDEEEMLQLLRVVLERNGYSVFTATSGEEALEITAGLGKSPDLLISDVILPGMHGSELAQTVVGQHPTTKILFITGYSESEMAQYGVEEKDLELLRKPFSLLDFRARVKLVLAGND